MRCLILKVLGKWQPLGQCSACVNRHILLVFIIQILLLVISGGLIRSSVKWSVYLPADQSCVGPWQFLQHQSTWLLVGSGQAMTCCELQFFFACRERERERQRKSWRWWKEGTCTPREDDVPWPKQFIFPSACRLTRVNKLSRKLIKETKHQMNCPHAQGCKMNTWIKSQSTAGREGQRETEGEHRRTWLPCRSPWIAPWLSMLWRDHGWVPWL